MDTSIREVTTSAAIEEKKKLRKEFRYFDMIFFTVTAIVGLDTLGAFSANGAQALTWLVISALTFFLPYGLLTAELGSTLPQEGGVYEWCKLAGGRLFAAFGAMLYWISTPLWVGGTLSVGAIAVIKTFWFGSQSYQFGGNPVTDALVEIVIALVFIWGVTWCTIMSLRVGKWLSIFGSYVKLALLATFVVLTLVFMLGGHAQGSIRASDLIPSHWGTIVSAILPILIFQWIGFEGQNGAGEEMKHPRRDVPRAILRAGLIATLAYAAFLIFILLALPQSQLSSVGSFFAAFQSVTSVLPAVVAKVLLWIAALAFIIAVASSGGTWLMASDRTYAISALDRTAPVRLGRFSGRYGTPIAVNILSGMIATIAMLVAILVNEFGGGSIVTLFQLVLGFVISTNILAYLFIFPTFLLLRYKYPRLHRPYKVPGGMVGAWVVTVLPLAYAAVASVFIIVPTSTGSVDRLTYELTQLLPLAFIVLLTVIFYTWGQAEKRNQDVLVEVPLGQERSLSRAGTGGE